MMKTLTRALLAAATFAAIFGGSASAEASYRRTHITKQHFGRYLAWRHLHYRHQRYRPMFVARKQPRFMQPMHTDCLHSGGQQARCYTHRGQAHVPLVAPAKVAYHGAASGRPSCFYVARALGGPCGCWAEWKLLGRVEHVLRDALGTWNPWLANDWARHFPHTQPAPGTAAVFPRHVAPVKDVKTVNGRVMALLDDSWAVHWVAAAGKIFVQPPGVARPRGAASRPALVSFAGAVPL